MEESSCSAFLSPWWESGCCCHNILYFLHSWWSLQLSVIKIKQWVKLPPRRSQFQELSFGRLLPKDRCFILPQINLASGAAFALECPEISDRMTIGDRTLAAIAFVGLRKWFHRNIWIKHGRRKEKSFDVSSFLAHPTTCQDTCSDKLRKKRKFIRVGGLSKHIIILTSIPGWLKILRKIQYTEKGDFLRSFMCDNNMEWVWMQNYSNFKLLKWWNQIPELVVKWVPTLPICINL